MHRLLVCLTLLCLCLVHSPARADLLVSWDLTNHGGDASITPTSPTAEVTGTALTRGPGLTLYSSSSFFSATGWDTAPAADRAADEDYFALGFTVAPGFAVHLEALSLSAKSLGTSTSSSTIDYGPGTLGLFYSGDSFTSILHKFEDLGAGQANQEIDLTSLGSLTGTVEFRIIELGNLDYNGTGDTDPLGRFRIMEHFGTGDVRLTGGVVTAVPEASAWLGGSLVCGLSAIGCVFRRWRQVSQPGRSKAA